MQQKPISVATQIEIVRGIPESMRTTAARLYEDAFGPKFAVAIPDQKQRLALLTESINLDFAFGAIGNGELVGVAGYKSREGSFTGGMTYHSLLKHTGILRGNWAAIVFGFYERSTTPDQLLMDGIVVDASLRGGGIGTRLLNEVALFASDSGYDSVRLDVVDTNPQARRMYERNGFNPTRTERFGYLRWLFGFGASTTLIRPVKNAN